MKCELCKEKPAETAIRVVRNGVEEELYVCSACAKAERLKKQKKSQRTRKGQGLPPGVTMSITKIGGDGETPPPVLEAIFDAVSGLVNDLGKAAGRDDSAPAPAEPEKRSPVSVEGVDLRYRLCGRLHLEGLNILGELEAVKRAADALELELAGVSADGIADAGHVYELLASKPSSARAKNFLAALVRQEENARIRLSNESTRVFGDSICRALAILKNCRLLAPAEMFDLFSPLRLAAMEDLLDGIGVAEIEKMASETDLSGKSGELDPDDRDREDAARADAMNGRFADVVLNERAEENFL